ncbi:MAG: hypothetical protein KME18_19195 [Phormidium tanganyikae FI6-MK23]|jgi:hypothetical protein|nr:hypothetical protein [Phormidium tanganyikae FI6-MK23]
MDFQELIDSVRQSKPYKIRQPRLWSLCVLIVSDDLKEKTPAIELSGVSGQYLLGFNFPPKLGEHFPYEGHIWRIIAEPIQFPTRYKSRGVKKSPILFAQYVESHENDDQILRRLLELSANSI